MPRPISNPPNPWATSHVDWLGEPPPTALEVYEEKAKTVLSENSSPDLGFNWSMNTYRGCFHACSYCLGGETPILMANGTTRPIAELRAGDEIYGTVKDGRYRRYVKTSVLDQWSTVRSAHRLTLTNGVEIIASADHRFLTRRGWKHVTGAEQGPNTRPHLTPNDLFLGLGRSPSPPKDGEAYRRGYLCGMIRGDGHLAHYDYDGRKQHQFRLALTDSEALTRAREYLAEFGVETREFLFQEATPTRQAAKAIRTHARASVERVEHLIEWPASPDDGWFKGFLAGIFDAEGSWQAGTVRIFNTDPVITGWVQFALQSLGFDFVVETAQPVASVRLRGGLSHSLRFVLTVAPAIARKKNIEGIRIKNSPVVRTASIERLGVDLPLYDITTGTGDFIANGVISHNCYARPYHQYWDFGAGTDWERKIVVKVNAPEVLRRQMMKKSWEGEYVMLSGATDCYQPLEASYELTRRCLEVFERFRNPIGIVTKGSLVRRDIDVLARMAKYRGVAVHLSIPFADDETARKVEPYTSSPSQRFETLRMLSEAGIPTGVAIAPIIPGLNDPDIPEILERAREAGARSAFKIMLRLPAEVKPVFRERMEAEFSPERVRKVFNAVTEMRGGKLYVSEFGQRMRGQGPRWQVIEDLFESHAKRLRYNEEPLLDWENSPFTRPGEQTTLFE